MSNKQTGTLTAEGAQLLRQARDQILRLPETFCMYPGECGTTACIAGHVARAMGRPIERWGTGVHQVAVALGFPTYDMIGPTMLDHALVRLFHGEANAQQAAERINAFLWSYGYPPDAIAVDVPININVASR